MDHEVGHEFIIQMQYDEKMLKQWHHPLINDLKILAVS